MKWIKYLIIVVIALCLASPAFGVGVKIEDLTADDVCGGSEKIPVDDAGTGKYMTPDTLLARALTLYPWIGSINALTETNGGLLYGTADNTYAWLAAGATGKLFMAKGAAAPEWTPYTFPATVPTVGKVLISDGTNLIGSTALGTAAYTASSDYQAASANLTTIAALTPAENKIMVGNSTPAWSLSAYTLAAPGTSGNIMKSDGNNWTSSNSLSIATLDMTSSTSSIPCPVGTAAAPTDEGKMYWNSFTDTLTVGDGAAAKAILPALNAPDLTFDDEKGILTETDSSDDYSVWEATDDVGGTPAQVDVIKVTNAGTGDAPTVVVGGATSKAIVKLNATADDMADDTFNGITIVGKTFGETVAQWDLVFLASDGKFDQADANAAGEFPAIGIATAGGNDTDAAVILVQGIARNEGWTGLTVGGKVYLGEDSHITQTAPSDSGDCVQLIGFALSDSEIYFCFTPHYLEVE